MMPGLSGSWARGLRFATLALLGLAPFIEEAVMNAYLEANRAVLDELYENLIAFLRPLDEDCLNWRPLASDTNSVAAMVTHTAGSIANWLGRALGEVP